MTPDTLRDAGEALFGPLWRSQLAQALGVTERTVRRWAAGEFAVPETVWADIAKLCRKRGRALERMAARLGEAHARD